MQEKIFLKASIEGQLLSWAGEGLKARSLGDSRPRIFARAYLLSIGILIIHWEGMGN